MSWTLTEIDPPTSIARFPFGSCWRQWLDREVDDIRYGELWRSRLSPEFLASERDFVWQIICPGTAVVVFCPDMLSTQSDQGWVVTGADDCSTLTVQPSIHAIGQYHGWLANGVLSDDIDGRTYEERS
jgi:hypothetical protein